MYLYKLHALSSALVDGAAAHATGTPAQALRRYHHVRGTAAVV